MSGSAPVAAVDVGTNSVRLLVLSADGQRLGRWLTITRLGQGVDETGHLHDDALARTLDTIGTYRGHWDELGARSVRIAATSAVRDASDRRRFFDGVRDRAGVEAQVLSGAEEAALSFAGATVGVNTGDGAVAVVDIGGGSTEIVVGDRAGRVQGSVSLQLGCVRLTERALTDDPPTAEQIAAANAIVEDRLQTADEVLAERGATVSQATTLIAVAGTATTVAALHLGLDEYREEAIHGTRIPAADVTTWTQRLATLPARERAALGPMQPGREDVIAGGVLILDAILRRYGFGSVTVSEADILDGLAASLLEDQG